MIIGIFQLENLTKTNNYAHIEKLFRKHLVSKLNTHKEITANEYKPISNDLPLKTISLKYPHLNYIVYGNYSLIENKIIKFTIKVIDLKRLNELDLINIMLYYPLNERSFTQLNNTCENILWSIVGVPFQIYSDPSESEIYINKKFVGRTPLKKLRGKAGIYEIIIYRKGYQIIKDKLFIRLDKENTFFYPLKTKTFLKKK
ncbi:MAG: PEGA domain-containing protein, partial [Spirochaetota bacterium]|nr:PEGA domain-containing protein [Spirochaetota bacterium]